MIPKDQFVTDIHDDHTKTVFRDEKSAYRNKVGSECIKGTSTNSPLYSRKTLFNFFKNDNNKFKTPIGLIEVKAKWIQNDVKGGSKFTTWFDYDDVYKVIFTKYTLERKEDKGNITPASWTPFEFNNVNPRGKHERGCITFKDMATKEFTAYI